MSSMRLRRSGLAWLNSCRTSDTSDTEKQLPPCIWQYAADNHSRSSNLLQACINSGSDRFSLALPITCIFARETIPVSPPATFVSNAANLVRDSIAPERLDTLPWNLARREYRNDAAGSTRRFRFGLEPSLREAHGGRGTVPLGARLPCRFRDHFTCFACSNRWAATK